MYDVHQLVQLTCTQGQVLVVDVLNTDSVQDQPDVTEVLITHPTLGAEEMLYSIATRGYLAAERKLYVAPPAVRVVAQDWLQALSALASQEVEHYE